MPQPYDWPLETLRDYRPPLTREADFDRFWEAALASLNDVPVTAQRVGASYPAPVVLESVEILGADGAMVRGWYARPRHQAEPLPGLVLFHGYNYSYEGGVNDVVGWALHGYAVLGMHVRGQSAPGVTPSPNEHVSGWMTQGILSPETYYYRGVYLDAVRAVQWLATVDEVRADRIAVVGGSQGGGLSLAAAALSAPAVAAVVSEFPFLAHFERAVDIAPEGPYGEICDYLRRHADPEIATRAFRTLSYFDVMNLAPRVAAPVLMSVGLVDTITPPSTIFATYNHLGSRDRDLAVYRYFGHEPIPHFVMRRLEFLERHLKGR
ncbi:MAG: alpha/beta fold hydrolase [Firmicutes bacterium]|nr:alpha/beta fold hydrolase [Bacillota bacterium]